MKKLVFATGNIHKGYEIEDYFAKLGIPVEVVEFEFHEPEVNDISVVSQSKVLEAYNVLQMPCFVIDSGFNIWGYPNNPGYPGAFVRRSGISENIDELLETMKDVENRDCEFMDCLTYYDGSDMNIFYGLDKGTLTHEKLGTEDIKMRSKLWFVFKPLGSDKTLAQMTDEERAQRKGNHVSAKEAFANWYKLTIMNTISRDRHPS